MTSNRHAIAIQRTIHMIIIQVAGGLGNQMQQYSLYRKLLHLNNDDNSKVKLDVSWFQKDTQDKMLAPRDLELNYFAGLPMTFCTPEEKERYTNRSILNKVISRINPSMSTIFMESEMYHPEIFDIKDKYIIGYFANQKYYNELMPELQQLFVFPIHSDPEMHLRNVDIMNEMHQRTSVSVHLRRGDYLSPENNALFGNIATDEYYDSAMNYFNTKDPSTHFYIFTNDVAYAKEKYSDTAKYTIIDWNTGKNSLLDIQLMSHCKGNICANSTFSFWGARLNAREDKEVIRTFTMRNNQPCDPDLMHDYWKGWILIDNKGHII